MKTPKVFMLCILLITICLANTFVCKAQTDTKLILHTVAKGENLYRIALKYGVSVDDIMSWNELDNPDYIKVGQQLKIWLPVAQPATPKSEDKNTTPAAPQKKEIPQETLTPEEDNKPKTRINLPFLPADSTTTKKTNGDYTYTGTRIAPKEEEFDSTGLLDISGYISTYYSYYTDSLGSEMLQKFPTLSPYSNEVGINVIQISANYTAQKIRGIVTLQWGDMPNAAWSPKYNLIQQANLGIRIVPKLWFDIGYFRTHIGLESVQPRENINSTIAVTTFVEPYYLSGAKLTYRLSPKITLQANAFSQFNGFVENNTKKALGFSAVIEPTENVSITLNTITSDDTPEEQKTVSHQRWYNDMYLSWKTKRTVLGFEFNFGQQTHSGLKDTTATAQMMSSLLAFKYKLTKKVALYTRGEYCKDPDGFLAGTYTNGKQKNVGIDIWGATGGLELKPIPNSYVRFEYRYLKQNIADGDIFYWNGTNRPFRNEFIFSTGFWF